MEQRFKVLALSAAAAVSLNASESFKEAVTGGSIDGQVRMFYVDREYSGKVLHRNGTSLGGHLNYTTGDYYGATLGVGFYTANRVFRGLEREYVDPTLFKAGGESYSLLGEAFVGYDLNAYAGTKTTLKLGRQLLHSPLAGTDDARTLPTLFNAYTAINKDVEHWTFLATHVSDIAPGTFSNAYDGGILGITGGYTAVVGNTAKYQGKFVNMGTWAVGEATAGVTAVAGIFDYKNIKVQLWDYYAWDILNAIYAQADVKWKCLLSDAIKPFAAAQIIQESDTGSSYAGDVDSFYWAAKLGATVANFTVYGAYSQTSSNGDGDAATENAVLTPWGGMPGFTQGMVTRHMFMAGTTAWKAAGTYNFKDLGPVLTATAYYASFDMDEKNGYSADYAWMAHEAGFDIIYYPIKELQLRFRGNFPSNYYQSETANVGWDEYRLIANYNF